MAGIFEYGTLLCFFDILSCVTYLRLFMVILWRMYMFFFTAAPVCRFWSEKMSFINFCYTLFPKMKALNFNL